MKEKSTHGVVVSRKPVPPSPPTLGLPLCNRDVADRQIFSDLTESYKVRGNFSRGTQGAHESPPYYMFCAWPLADLMDTR